MWTLPSDVKSGPLSPHKRARPRPSPHPPNTPTRLGLTLSKMNYGPHWAAKRHHTFFLQPRVPEGLSEIMSSGSSTSLCSPRYNLETAREAKKVLNRIEMAMKSGPVARLAFGDADDQSTRTLDRRTGAAPLVIRRRHHRIHAPRRYLFDWQSPRYG